MELYRHVWYFLVIPNFHHQINFFKHCMHSKCMKQPINYANTKSKSEAQQCLIFWKSYDKDY